MVRGRHTRRIPDWMIGLAIACVGLGLVWVRPAFLESTENQSFDLCLKWSGSRAPAQNIVIVALDEDSISKLGNCSCPLSRIAALGSVQGDRELLQVLQGVRAFLDNVGRLGGGMQRAVQSRSAAALFFKA